MQNPIVLTEKTNADLIRKREVILIIKEILYNSLAQAIFRIFQTRHIILRTFLFVCVSVTTVLSSYLVIQSIISYFSFEVYTSSRSVFEIPALFPKVTICNQNMFTTKYAVEFLRDINKLVEPQIDIFNEDNLANLSYANKTKTFKNVFNKANSMILSDRYTDEIRKKVGHSLRHT